MKSQLLLNLNTITISFLLCLFSMNASSQVSSYDNQIYYYHEGGSLITTCWIPFHPDSQTVRGIIYCGNPGTGGNLSWVRDKERQDIARQYGFGLASTAGNAGWNTYSSEGAFFLRAFDSWAALGHHPELENVPFVTVGNSSAGAFAYGMAMLVPERTICFCSNVPAELNPREPSDVGIKVPGILTCGEIDYLTGNLETGTIGDRMRVNRARGALWSKIELPGMGHEHRRTMHLFYPFIEKCIELRLPVDADAAAGPVTLNEIDIASGWIADDSTWNSGFTEIWPYTDFPADRDTLNSSWLLDEDMAFLHRQYSSVPEALHIVIPDSVPWTDHPSVVVKKLGDSVTLYGKTFGGYNWDRVELYEGAAKIDEITGGGTTFEFDVYLTNKGISSKPYSVIGYDGSNNPSTSYMFTFMALGGDVSADDSIPPTPPTNITQDDSDVSSIDISWTAATDNDNVAGYYVYINGTRVNDEPVSETGYTVTDLFPALDYTVNVRAVDDAGNLSPDIADATISTYTPTGMVYLSDITEESSANGLGQIEKDMTVGTAAAGDGDDIYLDGVYYPKGLGVYGESEIVYDLGGNYSYLYTISDVEYNTNSWVNFEIYVDGELVHTNPYINIFQDTVVIDVTGANELKLVAAKATELNNHYGTWVNSFLLPAGFDDDSEAPAQVSSIEASEVKGNMATIEWPHSSDNIMTAYYVVYLDGDSVGTTTKTNYNFNGLSTETQYQVSLKAVDAAGNEAAVSNEVSFTTTNEIVKITKKSGIEFKLFPNPTTGNVTIDLGNTYNNICIELYSITGQLLQQNTFGNANSINMNLDIPQGMYFINVISDSKERTVFKVVRE